MTTSQTRRNRRRRKAAAAAVAVGASAALLAGTTLTAPPAQAALFPLSIGSIGELPVISTAVAACDAGDPDVQTALGSSADCTNATPWLLTPVADAILGLVAPDLAGLISIGGLNGALATWGPELDLVIGGDPSLGIPGKSTISGSGYTTAIVLLGGEATASADYVLAAAVALAATGGIANANSLFGVSVATAVGRPATQAGIGPWAVGNPRVENSAKARSLPLGIAIANSSVTPGELFGGLINDVPQFGTSTVALGGVTTAYRSIDGSRGAVCTALYGEARVHEQTLNNDGDVVSSQRTNSCTSALFIFQKQQNVGEHGGFEVYAIKNPFDIGFVSPFGDNIAGFLSQLTGEVIDLGAANDILAGRIVPEFQSDIIRVVMTDDGPKLETDLPAWLEELFGSTPTGSPLPFTLAAADEGVPAGEDVASTATDAAIEVTAKSTEESVSDAGIAVVEPNPLPPVETPELADPPAIEIVDSAPQESPQPEAPAEQTPAEQAPAEQAPADETPTAAAPETASDAELESSLG